MLMFLAQGPAFLAQVPATPPPAQNNFGDTLGDGVAGPTALLIIVLLGIGTALLIRNMNRHLKRLPDRFPIPASGAATAGGLIQAAGAEKGGAPTGSRSAGAMESSGSAPAAATGLAERGASPQVDAAPATASSGTTAPAPRTAESKAAESKAAESPAPPEAAPEASAPGEATSGESRPE